MRNLPLLAATAFALSACMAAPPQVTASSASTVTISQSGGKSTPGSDSIGLAQKACAASGKLATFGATTMNGGTAQYLFFCH